MLIAGQVSNMGLSLLQLFWHKVFYLPLEQKDIRRPLVEMSVKRRTLIGLVTSPHHLKEKCQPNYSSIARDLISELI